MAMDEILEAFIQESNELLIRMEELLLSLESDPENSESLNGIFRSVHTIKGSAGMFGFEWIVEFTHVLENLLEYMRSGKIKANSDIIEELLKSKDYLMDIVELQCKENNIPDSRKDEGRTILFAIKPYLDEIISNTRSKESNYSKTSPESDYDKKEYATHSPKVNSPNYHISLRPNKNVFINALDPLSFIKYLQELGSIQYLRTIVSSLPDWSDWNPEICSIGFEIRLESKKPIQEIKNVFEFLEYDSTVLVLPPNAEVLEFKDQIEKLPEDEIFLSNLFHEMGTLSQEELVFVLESFHSQLSPSHQNYGSSGSISTEDKKIETSPNQETKSVLHSTLRVDSVRIDNLINKVGELVVSEANLSQLLQNKEDAILTESLHSVSRLIHEIREISLKLRMIPIGDSFNKYHRIVRDLGNELSKKVILHIKGGETELDKTVMEKLSDPMVHIVRNAIDHGLETTEERIAAGKSPEGNISLNAFHETGSIIIEISDDGKGIDHERVHAKAIEKGILASDAKPSLDEIHRLLFHPGFSTADKVTNISGRGVGLDVVQKNIESLRGTIQVHSSPGEGTYFKIRLPLTLAIIDGFLVSSGTDNYVIPLDMVRECVDFREDLKVKDQSGSFFNLRGTILPYVRLDEFFHGEIHTQERENILITEFQGERFGLIVGTLYGELQTVIKPLAKIFEQIRGIGGSTTLGDGSIALILDIGDLHLSLKENQAFDTTKESADTKTRH